jgi:oxygen-dependent protoporphyrinogen oxidase
MTPVVVIGGGISGLSTAYYLWKASIRCTLIERQSRLGGVIATERVGDCLLEAGPDSFLAAKPWAMDLIRELGLASEVIGSNDHRRVTYVLRRGRLIPLPDGLMLMVPTRIRPMVTTRLLGVPTKLRMGLEWFRFPPPRPVADRSVADFVLDHYGAETVAYLAEPLLAGVFGGDVRELSAPSVLPRLVELEEKYGSLTRGVLMSRTGGARSGGRTSVSYAARRAWRACREPREEADRPDRGPIRSSGNDREAGARLPSARRWRLDRGRVGGTGLPRL